MHIWILNHYAVTPDLPGGTRHFDFGRELVKEGHNVTIFASAFHHSQFKYVKIQKKQLYKIENLNGVKFVWIKTFPYKKNDWRRVLSMLDFALKVFIIGMKFPAPDIIIGSSVHLLSPLSAYLLSLHFKVPFIMEVRDLWPDTLVDMGKLSRKSFVFILLKKLELFLYKKAKRIIYIPPYASDYFSNLGVPLNKTKNIPNGVDLNRFPKSLGELNASDQVFKLTYTGHFGPSAGLKDAIKAINLIIEKGYNVLLRLIGDGSEKNILEEMVKGGNLSSWISIIGPVPKEEVYKYLIASDALLHIELDFDTSKWGGSPNKIYDYLASGKPIVYCSNFVKEWLDKINCGLYAPPGNAEKLANTIVEIINMKPEERAAMGERGRKYVEEYNSISILSKELLSLINSVIGAERT